MTEIIFSARLEAQGPRGAWLFVFLPRRASKALGARGRVPVVGTINGCPFRSSAFPTGDGTHQIAVSRAMQSHARAAAGDRVRVALRVDLSRLPSSPGGAPVPEPRGTPALDRSAL